MPHVTVTINVPIDSIRRKFMKDSADLDMVGGEGVRDLDFLEDVALLVGT